MVKNTIVLPIWWIFGALDDVLEALDEGLAGGGGGAENFGDFDGVGALELEVVVAAGADF